LRLWIALLAGFIFAALLILDPQALAQLGYACATGQCGIQPRDLALGASSVVALWAVIYGFGLWRRSIRRKKMARAKTAAATQTKRPRAKPAATAPRKPRAAPRAKPQSRQGPKR
jgi:hypothetical protein